MARAIEVASKAIEKDLNHLTKYEKKLRLQNRNYGAYKLGSNMFKDECSSVKIGLRACEEEAVGSWYSQQLEK